MSSEPADDRPPLLSLEIRGDRPLAAIAGMEIGGRERLTVLSLDERRAPGAGVVSRTRPLHLHDVGAEIGKKLTRPWSGEDRVRVQGLGGREAVGSWSR